MKITPLLDQSTSQADFAEMVGISEARVSQLMADGVMPRSGTVHDWLLAYCDRLRDQAAGRAGTETGGLDLVQERAALAREQRIAQELKNQTARGEYAPIGLLADVLAQAASSVVDRFDLLEGTLRKSCPGITDEVLLATLGIVSSARNEWLRATARLVDASVDLLADDDIDTGAALALTADDDGGIWGPAP